MFTEVFSHRAKRSALLSVTVFFLVFFSGVAGAAPPEPEKGNGVPQYMAGEFEEVKRLLEVNAAKMDALNAELLRVESRLQGDIATAKIEIMNHVASEIGQATEAIKDDLGLLLNDDIEMTTEFCFDLGAAWDWAYTGKLAGGLGWEAVLKGEASLELATPGILPFPYFALPIVPSLNAGVGNAICITVPLYSTESGALLIAEDDIDTESFDNFVQVVASPAQTLVPLIADVFGEVFPAPEASMLMVASSLEMFDTRSNNLTLTGLESGSVGLQKADGQSSYLNADPAAQFAAAMAFEDMLFDSSLLSYITDGGNIESAIADPCGFARDLDGTAAAGVADAVCIFKKAVADPLCVLDIFNIIPACKD